MELDSWTSAGLRGLVEQRLDIRADAGRDQRNAAPGVEERLSLAGGNCSAAHDEAAPAA
jgi:hypothetical protein